MKEAGVNTWMEKGGVETGLKKTEVDTGLKTAEGEMIEMMTGNVKARVRMTEIDREMMTEQHRIEVEPSPENGPD